MEIIENNVDTDHISLALDEGDDVNAIRYEDDEYHSSDEDVNEPNKPVPIRGRTMLAKFRRQYGHPGQAKHKVTFDGLNRVTGPNRALFSSFLGDTVRDQIGLKVLSWKKVDEEARKKLWDEITVHIYLFLTQYYIYKFNLSIICN